MGGIFVSKAIHWLDYISIVLCNEVMLNAHGTYAPCLAQYVRVHFTMERSTTPVVRK